ncbi:MAG: hypothetical protein JWR69_4628 [Pedosphaera sp.]|nr:hypothetical protein [Pedosphaera sp.]
MAKRVFFSFHYQDVADFRVNVVRNHWVTKEGTEDAGFLDGSLWEEAEKKGSAALKKLINGGLNGTTVTTVLIGSSTYSRPWVHYEIFASIKKGNTLLGVHINGIPDKNRVVAAQGPNPMQYLALEFSAEGTFARPRAWDGAKWIYFDEHEGWTLKSARPESQRGQTLQLTTFSKTYDWQSDDGFNNFSSWLGE